MKQNRKKQLATRNSLTKGWALPLLALLFCAALVSCSDDDNDDNDNDIPNLPQLVISAPQNSFVVNDTIQVVAEETLLLRATLESETGPEQPVLWISSDPSIASVDATGLVTGVAEGPVVITATSVETPELKERIALRVSGPNTILAFSIEGLEGVYPVITDTEVTFEIDFNKEGNALDVAQLTTLVTHNGASVSTPGGTPEEVEGSTATIVQDFTGGPVTYTVSTGEEARTYHVSVQSKPGTEFITTWNTDEITIPTNSEFTYSYNVDTNNDGFIDQTGITESTDVTLGEGLILRISGQFPAIFFNEDSESNKIATLEQWGTVAWESMAFAFFGCENLEVPATDVPDLSRVISMASMFSGAAKANPDVSQWNTSSVTNMSRMFLGATKAEPDVSEWNTSSVTNMIRMFNETDNANPDVGEWDTSSVTNMNRMFNNANNAEPDVQGWDIGNVTNVDAMFNGATKANPDLSGWNISNVTDMFNVYNDSGLSRENYEKALIRFAEHAVPDNGLSLPQDIGLGGVPVSFCSPQAQAAATTLEDKGWTLPAKAEDCQE